MRISDWSSDVCSSDLAMDIPDSLARRIELWRLHGRIFRESAELFGATSWIAVMLGQNIWPDRYDPVADTLDEAKVAAAMAEMRAAYRRAAERLQIGRAHV